MNQARYSTIFGVASRRKLGITVVLEDIHDPHNAAAILRTCDAFGIQYVWFVFDKEKSYNPATIGKASSSSANKWLDITVFDSSQECIGRLKSERRSVIVTTLTPDAAALTAYSTPDNDCAVVFGNEHRGVSDRMIDAADTVLRIPMIGFVQSLNVSVTAGIVLWKLTNDVTAPQTSEDRHARERSLLMKRLLRKGSETRK